MRLRLITCPPFSDINEPHLYWISYHSSAESSNKKELQVRNTILSSRSDSLASPGSVSDKNGGVIHCCILHTVLRLLTPTHASCQIFSSPHSASDVGFYIKCQCNEINSIWTSVWFRRLISVNTKGGHLNSWNLKLISNNMGKESWYKHFMTIM